MRRAAAGPLLWLAGFALFGCASPSLDRQASRPNVLVVIADDLGYSDIGALGSEIPTPHIDSLADDGVLFTNFHTAATCSPSRAMLLTGVDSHLAGLGNMATFLAPNQRGKPGYEGHLNDRVVSLGELFQDAGYATGFFGKWHLGDEPGHYPADRGFAKTLALLDGSGDNWSDMGSAPVLPITRFTRNGQQIERPEGFSSTLFTDALLEFLGEPTTRARPFLAVLSFQAVHWPHHAPDEFLERHADGYTGGWDRVRRARHERLIELGLIAGDTPLRPRDPRIPAWDDLPEPERATEALRMGAYAAMLEHMDFELGRVLAALDEQGDTEDTIVVFVSDNGPDQSEPDRTPRAIPWYEERYPHLADPAEIGRPGSHPSYGPQWAQSGAAHLRDYKGSSAEGGMRVPFLVRYPAAIPGGQRIDALGFATDLVPTLLELAALDHPALSEAGDALPLAPTGRSAAGVLRGTEERIHPPDEPIGYELMATAALFRGDHKLVRIDPPMGSGKWMLFDLAADPGEVHDLAETQPALTSELERAFDDYSQRVGVVRMPEDYDVFKVLTSPPANDEAQSSPGH